MTSEESKLCERLLARARSVATRCGRLASYTAAYVWTHQVGHDRLHILCWRDTCAIDVRFIGPPGGISRDVYSMREGALGEPIVRFSPDLALIALDTIDRYMVLDDLAQSTADGRAGQEE